MEGVRSFRDLDAWKVAMELANSCYSVAKKLPNDERFGLAAQLRRACVSVPSNIAEGFATRADGLFRRHLTISLGSVGEADLSIAQEGLVRTRKLVFGLRRSVKARLIQKAAKTATSCLVLAMLASKLLGL